MTRLMGYLPAIKRKAIVFAGMVILACTSLQAQTPSDIAELRHEQDYLKQAMRDNIDASHFLLTIFAYLLAGLVVLQGVREWAFERSHRKREDVLERQQTEREDALEKARRAYDEQLRSQWTQREDMLEQRRSQREDALELERRNNEERLRTQWIARDDRLESRRSIREQRIDALAQNSVRSISSILNVLHRTLEARRVAEAQARTAAAESEAMIKGLTGTIDKLTAEISNLKQVGIEVKRTRDNERQAIEFSAAELAKTARHQFRLRLKAFDHYSQQYDGYRARYGSDERDAFLDFTSVASYVRGIAAHYFNDPANATKYLEKVIADRVDNDNNEVKRRIVVLYLLGIIESNFEAYEKADVHFRNALALEPKPQENETLLRIPPDFLTRVVAAEAAAISNNLVVSEQYLVEIDKALAQIRKECSAGNIPFSASHRRLGERAALVRANQHLRTADYSSAISLLEPIVETATPRDYYAKATLAQLYFVTGKLEQSQKLFRDCYTSIQALGDLSPESITEVRSRILLLMTAAVAAHWGNTDRGMALNHLDEAVSLIEQLPKRGGQMCSVFSTFSKRNESSRAIALHIDQIRAGKSPLLQQQ